MRHWNQGAFNSALIDFHFCLDQFELTKMQIKIFSILLEIMSTDVTNMKKSSPNMHIHTIVVFTFHIAIRRTN